jgi:hypothetical protein
MGTVHDLIEQQGKQAALLAEADRRAVEAAASYLADEDTGIGLRIRLRAYGHEHMCSGAQRFMRGAFSLRNQSSTSSSISD